MTLLVMFCRAGRSSGRKFINGEYPHRVSKYSPSTFGMLESAVPGQIRVGYSSWFPEQTGFRSLSTQVQSDAGVEEGKPEEVPDVENEADDNTDGFSIGKAVEGALEDSASGSEAWDEERIKSQRALWKKIESVKQGPQKSVVPLIKEWLNEGYVLDKHVLVTILIRLRRRQRYKQAMEVSFLSDIMSNSSI